MSGSASSGAARKLLPTNPSRKFVTISQEIFRVKSPMLCVDMDIDFIWLTVYQTDGDVL